MAVCFEEQVKRDIASKNFAPCYIIYGDDAYLKKQLAEKLSSAVVSPDDFFNFQRFIGECNLQEVFDAKEQLPMMADKKCVILKDYDFEHCDKADFDKLIHLCQEKNDDTILIVWFDTVKFDPKKSDRFSKITKAAEKGSGKVVQVGHRSISELSKMLCDGSAKRGCSLSYVDARYMVELAGEDINILKNELEKVCAYVNKGEITKEIIDKVCIGSVEQSVYNLSGEILAGNVTKAVSILDELMFMRVPAMVIFTTVSSFYVDIARAKSAVSAGLNAAACASDFGYGKRAFVIEKALSMAKALNQKQIRLSFAELMNTDARLKSFSGSDRTALEEMIVRLSYISAKGEAVDKA